MMKTGRKLGSAKKQAAMTEKFNSYKLGESIKVPWFAVESGVSDGYSRGFLCDLASTGAVVKNSIQRGIGAAWIKVKNAPEGHFYRPGGDK